MNRFLIAVLIIFVASLLFANGERKTKLYPGTCPNGESWYLVDSDSDSVTVGCYDPDYSEPQ
jgi:hypothetical protein